MNQLKNDHYVYVLKDVNNTIRYIGEGRLDRYKQTFKRPAGYIDILNSGGTVEKIHEGLTKQGAKDKENYYLEKYIGVNNGEWNLLNTAGPRKQVLLAYEEVSEYFSYDLSDPRLLISRTPTLGEILPSKKFVGFIDKYSGYYKVTFNGKQCKSHRLLWVLYNKKDLDPFVVINHIDGVKHNNLPENLEAVSSSVNSYKSLNKRVSDVTGISGVSTTISSTGATIYRGSYMCQKTQIRQEKSFSSARYGHDVALRLASMFREIGVYQYESEQAMLSASDRFHEEFQKYNTLPIGVSVIANHGRPNQVVSVCATVNGVERQKRFSINKYGYDEAINLAVEWRSAQLSQSLT